MAIIFKHILLLPLALLLSFMSHAQDFTFEEAEAAHNAQAPMQDQCTEQFMTAQGEAINAAWQLTGPCFKMGVEQRVTLILRINGSGAVQQVWASSDNVKAECLRIILQAGEFPTPPWQPYFDKIVM